MNNLFNQSKPASEYPKDWYVIPTMEVIEMFKTLKSCAQDRDYFDCGEKVIALDILEYLTNQSQQSILETPNKKQNVDIKTLKSEWRKLVQRMKFMSGEVAVFELESLLDRVNSQQIVTEGVSHSNTMGTHANRPADVKGCL